LVPDDEDRDWLVASVPQYNSPQESRRPAPLPDVSTPAATPDAFGGTAARNQIRTGETLMRAGSALADVKMRHAGARERRSGVPR
jgi:hypothetical protein